MTQSDDKFLVLVPLQIERKFIAASLSAMGFESSSRVIGAINLEFFPQLNLELAVGGHGKTQFGIQTQFLLHHLSRVQAVVCAGCAGGLDSRLHIGDVVVAEKTIEHDYRLRFVQRPPPEFLGDAEMIRKSKAQAFGSFRVHQGIIASGDEDVIELTRANEIQASTNAIAVAWEGAGGARACQFNRVPFLEIRGLTDTADHRAVDDFSRNLEQAMRNVTELIVRLRSQ